MAKEIKIHSQLIREEQGPISENGLIQPVEFVPKGIVNEETGLIQPAEFIDKNKKGPEDKMYLVFYIGYDEEGNEYKSFESPIGRTETYRLLKNMAEYIDIHESRVLVEGVTLENSITVYEFMKHVSIYYEDDGFDIEDYNTGDVSSDEEVEYIDPELRASLGVASSLTEKDEALNLWNSVMSNPTSINNKEDLDKIDEEDLYV